jgi:pyrroline-5-carboxylate reductase
MSGFSVALVGAGNMGGAMLSGWLDNGFSPDLITVIDPSPNDAVAATITEYGLRRETSAPQGLNADVVLVALKPQVMDAALPSVKPLLGPKSVVVSVAAGKTLSSMEAVLGDVPIVRTMPNTPAAVRRGITVCVGNQKVNATHRDNVTALLRSIGLVEWVEDEALIDAVTGLSGSGPAYVFNLAEAMAAAGIAAGLPEALAKRLARATVSGAGELMYQSPLEVDELRRNVTSPNGTTQAALEVLMGDEGLTPLMTKAVAASTKRAGELAG